jgi:hypothetical protein
MIQLLSQRIICRISPQPHKAELYLKPPKTRFITHYSSDVHSSLCQFRSDPAKNLVDKGVRFRFHAKQIVSNIHRGAEDGLRP